MGHHKSSKDQSSKHKKHKKRHKTDEKIEKSHKKRRKYSSDSDSSSSSGSDVPSQKFDVNTQLAMGRAAARAIREILAYNYELRSEIRQLARHLDSGNALDISGLTDAFLLSRLCILFDNLTHLRKTSAGHYMLISKGSTVTSFVAPFLEETPSSLASYAAASAQQDHAAITTTAFAGGTAPEEGKQGSNPKREFADNVPTAFENADAKGDRRTSVQ